MHMPLVPNATHRSPAAAAAQVSMLARVPLGRQVLAELLANDADVLQAPLPRTGAVTSGLVAVALILGLVLYVVSCGMQGGWAGLGRATRTPVRARLARRSCVTAALMSHTDGSYIHSYINAYRGNLLETLLCCGRTA